MILESDTAVGVFPVIIICPLGTVSKTWEKWTEKAKTKCTVLSSEKACPITVRSAKSLKNLKPMAIECGYVFKMIPAGTGIYPI